MNKFNKVSIVIFIVAFSFITPITIFAADAPSLGTASQYGSVSTTLTNTAAGTTINGKVCYTNAPAMAPTISILPVKTPCDTEGTDQNAALNTATNNLNNQTCTSLGAAAALDNVAGTHPTGVYTPGCYSTSGSGETSMTITTGQTVTLSGAGVYIFKAAGALKPAANTTVVLTNGATADKVFWAPVEATTLGANVVFVGNILDAAGITLGHLATLLGRALAFGGTITTDANTITVPATLRIEKTVVGSSDPASAFTINIKNNLDVLVGTGVGAVTPGTSYSLGAGTYTVSEVANSSYTTIFGTDCVGGSVTLAAGDNKLCTIVNNFISLSPTGGSGTFAPLPLINITKIPYPLALPDGPGLVNYTYTVTNIGVVPMIGVWVKDNKCSTVNYVSGDTNKDSILNLTETWIYRCTKTVSQTETNTVTAHGQANGWDGYDTANATVVVGATLTPPLIHLVKVPSAFTLPIGGGAVTYTYTVTNPGTVPLSDVSITDDKCTGLPGRVLGHPGDLNKNNLLESNESWSFTCETNLTQTTTNIGTALGHANGLIAVDLSPATVVVATPSLPSTGFGPDNHSKILWGIVISTGIFMAVLFSAYLVQKERIINTDK